MKNEWINAMNGWVNYFNKEYKLNWTYDISPNSISIFENTTGYGGVEILIDNIVGVINESCELVFQLKDNQSISILGYDPKTNFYVT